MEHNTSNKNPTSGFRSADDSGIPVPSRMQILEFMVEENRPVTARHICSHFDLDTKGEKQSLQGRLDRMRRSGLILQDRKQRYGLPEKMNMVLGRVQGHADGFGFVIPDDGSADLYLHFKQMRKVLHGDRVLARQRSVDHRGRREGAIVEVLMEQPREIVGRFYRESGVGFIQPDDPRYSVDISIPRDHYNSAKDGDIVVARIIEHPVTHHHAVGKIIEVLGREMAPGMEAEIALRKHDIPHDWPAQVTRYIRSHRDRYQHVSTKSDRKSSRVDVRDLALVTIDGADAKDFDDAVYCEQNKSGWRLVVAIADVSHYVPTGSALDIEALERGNSVYFPNRVVPMLPEELSNGICSLNPDEDRNCMVCDMQVDNSGEVKRFEFYPAVMHSHARLTYELVEQIVVNKDEALRKAWSHVVPALDRMYQLFRAFIKSRRSRGTVDFEIPEAYIEFDDNKKIQRIGTRKRNQSHRLIEECMLAANVCAAHFLADGKHGRNDSKPLAIYRNHQGPDDDSLVELRKFLSGLGLQLGGGNSPQASDYAKLVDQVADRPEISGIVQSVLLRSLSQAEYGTEQTGHFALAYPLYTHFTSPIRRYPDLVVHRLIKQQLGLLTEPVTGEGDSLPRIAEHCSFTERRAEDAVRDVIGWLKAEFMQDRIGEVFHGTVTGVKEFGLFVQLDEIFVDGLVHVTALGNDYYQYDPARYALIGERTGRRFRLGDKLEVRVVRVDMDSAKIDFELTDVDPTSTSRRPKSKASRSRGKGRNKDKNKPAKNSRKNTRKKHKHSGG